MQTNSFEEIQRYLQSLNATKEEFEEVMYWVQRGVAYAGLKVHPDRAPWCIADGEMVHRHR